MKFANSFLTVLVLLGFVGFSLAGQTFLHTPFVNAQTSPSSSTIQASVPSGEYIRVITPNGTNISLVSVSGGYYELSNSVLENDNLFQFVPTNVSSYSIILHVNSNTSGFAYISKESNPFDTTLKNITGVQNLILTIDVNATTPPTSNSSWDPLFGFTGIRLQSLSFSFFNAMEIVLALGLLIIALGIIFHSKISYLGAVLLFFVGAMELGFLTLFVVIIAYVVSFAFVNIAWRIRSRRNR